MSSDATTVINAEKFYFDRGHSNECYGIRLIKADGLGSKRYFASEEVRDIEYIGIMMLIRSGQAIIIPKEKKRRLQ